ncbi:MAG: hypothetical protein ABIS67_11945 [Candidatus Eisenbacteria bacterium]
MTIQESPTSNENLRILALERGNRRLSGLVVLLLLMALAQTAWHLLPGPGVVAAHRFVLKQRGGVPRGEFSIWKDGTPAFRINNPSGEARALWALRQDGTLSLRMTGPNHHTRVEMYVDPSGRPHVTLYGDDGRSRAVLFVDAANRAELKYLER